MFMSLKYFRSPSMQREFDILLYGASGYTAKHVISKLAKQNVKIALAGRNGKSIKRNISDIKIREDVPIFECQSNQVSKISSLKIACELCDG